MEIENYKQIIAVLEGIVQHCNEDQEMMPVPFKGVGATFTAVPHLANAISEFKTSLKIAVREAK